MRIIKTGTEDFERLFRRIEGRAGETPLDVELAVKDILADVRERGDEAVMDYTERFDRLLIMPEEMRVSKSDVEAAYDKVSDDEIDALRFAAERITRFHEKQMPQSWFFQEETGALLGQRVLPLDAVGIYVPGGKAAYPSTVLMNALPAKVAGVKRIVMVMPAPGGELSPHALVAADMVGLDEIYRIGGAQAVAALAYGTATVPKVDKIVGPGNIYVATAKRLVFGEVDIDMVAGPSEILVVADKTATPAYVAADMLSQAEHDEMASALMVTDDEKLAKSVAKEIESQVAELSRRKIAEKSLKDFGAIIITKDMDEAADIVNRVAPEHLELSVHKPFDLLPKIRHAGAIFMGHHTPEAVGDYVAGPNHVLPTGGTARFFSPLSTEDFVKKSSLISFTKKALDEVSDAVIALAEMEGLEAHGRMVEMRVARKKGK